MPYPVTESIEIYRPEHVDPDRYSGKVHVVLPVHTQRSAKRWSKDAALMYTCNIRAARWTARRAGFKRSGDTGPFDADEVGIKGAEGKRFICEEWSRTYTPKVKGA